MCWPPSINWKESGGICISVVNPMLFWTYFVLIFLCSYCCKLSKTNCANILYKLTFKHTKYINDPYNVFYIFHNFVNYTVANTFNWKYTNNGYNLNFRWKKVLLIFRNNKMCSYYKSNVCYYYTISEKIIVDTQVAHWFVNAFLFTYLHVCVCVCTCVNLDASSGSATAF